MIKRPLIYLFIDIQLKIRKRGVIYFLQRIQNKKHLQFFKINHQEEKVFSARTIIGVQLFKNNTQIKHNN